MTMLRRGKRSLAGFVLGLLVASSAQALPQLELRMEPEAGRVRPDLDAVTMVLAARDGERPIAANWSVAIELTAPPAHPLVSTSFPIVEGTTLLRYTVPVINGEARFTFVPPIRGSYHLAATLLAASGEPLTTATFAPRFPENPEKVRHLTWLVTGLALIGGITGWLIASSQPSPGARTIGLVATLLWGLGAGSPPAAAHGGHHDQGAAVPLETNTASGISTGGGAHGQTVVDLKVEGTPRVGELVTLQGSLHCPMGCPRQGRVHLTITNLEGGDVVFAGDLPVGAGAFTWRGQLYDGAPHRLRVEAKDGAKGEAELMVEAIHPPLSASLKAFGLLISVAAAAMAIGYLASNWWKTRTRGTRRPMGERTA